MTSLLRTTALASVLALAAPYPALADDAKTQADFHANAQTQSFEGDAAANAGADLPEGASLAGNADLMASFERLRMLDDIGNVEVVKLEAGEFPEGAATTGAASDMEAEDFTAGTMPDAGSEDLAAAGEPDPTAEDRIESGFEAGDTAAVPSDGASEFETAADAAAGADIAPEMGADTQMSDASGFVEDAEAEAGALYGETDAAEAGIEPDSTDRLAAATDDEQPSGEAADSGEVSATFIEDTVDQIPEIKQALEANGAEATDIVQVDIGESGDVTLYVR